MASTCTQPAHLQACEGIPAESRYLLGERGPIVSLTTTSFLGFVSLCAVAVCEHHCGLGVLMCERRNERGPTAYACKDMHRRIGGPPHSDVGAGGNRSRPSVRYSS